MCSKAELLNIFLETFLGSFSISFPLLIPNPPPPHPLPSWITYQPSTLPQPPLSLGNSSQIFVSFFGTLHPVAIRELWGPSFLDDAASLLPCCVLVSVGRGGGLLDHCLFLLSVRAR